MFTLCSLVYNNSDYLFYQEKICRKIAKYDYKRIIIGSGENLEEREKLKKLQNTSVLDGSWINNFSGSQAHGIAVNEIFKHINTEFAIILDLDIVPLIPNWDEMLLNQLKNGIDVIGVPYNPLHGRRRIQNMPTVFFFAFNVQKIQDAKLDFRTLPTPIRKKIYWLYTKINKKIFRNNSTPKLFDFEMSQYALFKMKLLSIKTIAFEMKQPWANDAILKFDISELPLDRTLIDPLNHSYPEEWHWNGKPFLTHQRRSYVKSFNQTDYSRDWVRVTNEYLIKNYGIDITDNI
jgi:hypothetical protein